MKLRTVIVVPHHSGVANTMECLRSLDQQTARSFLTVLVQNGSKDPLNDSETSSMHNLCEIRIRENSGFTGAVNTGIRYALNTEAEFIWLVNNDTIVPPNTLSSLVLAAETHPDHAAFTPLIYQHPSKNVWFAGSSYDENRMFAFHAQTVPDVIENDVTDIPWSTGCAMFLRRSALGEFAPFDERFFLKWEDVDLSLRLRFNGWRIGLVWNSALYHKVSRACPEESPLSIYYDTRNHLLFAKKHAKKRDHKRTERGIIAYHLLGVLRKYLHGAPFNRTALPCVLGVRDHMRGRYGRMEWVR